MAIIEHNPAPGSRAVYYRGDTVTFRLVLDTPQPGSAWLRTNVGHAHERRQEIINHVERQQPILSRDWHDIEMLVGEDATTYTLEVPLTEVGRFEAKAFFLPEGENDPVWPEGENIILKVEPADTVCGNSVYTAFARQFRPSMTQSKLLPQRQDMLRKLDDDGFTVIPKSGTLRGLVQQLDHIIDRMGFRIIQLLPIHPVPTTYARMGRFGSPFASIDFFDVDPALAEFDRKTTPLDQFGELVDGIHARNAKLFLDLPINHTGWASHLQLHHPDWFARTDDEAFLSPGAWGVTWEDLSELDYAHRDLWTYMAGVFLFWCRRGVDGFRCDAGYMVPLPVWKYIVAKVRDEFPDTIFLLEGLGGKICVTEDLLDRANLNWAYSEIFQVEDRLHMENYLPRCDAIMRDYGSLIHFAETHDNNRLAARSPEYARMRTVLAALCSEAGTFGITNGVEWFATSKVDVHGAPPLNWGAEENQVETLTRLNTLLTYHPAFHQGVPQRLVHTHHGNAIALLRTPPNAAPVIVVANLDTDNPGAVTWQAADFDVADGQCHNLLDDGEHKLLSDHAQWVCALEPAEILCLSPEPFETPAPRRLPPAIADQLQRATALSLYRLWTGNDGVGEAQPDKLAAQLMADPIRFCEMVTGDVLSRSVTLWHWPKDKHRTVMLPYGQALLLIAEHPFHAELRTDDSPLAVERSLQSQDGSHFAFLHPPATDGTARALTLAVTVRRDKISEHAAAPVLQLPPGDNATVATRLDRETLRGTRRYALLTNDCGAMSQVRLEWGEIESQYDCLLGANLHEDVPVDRHIAFSRCRAWVVYRDYSQAITLDCLEHVTVDLDRMVRWNFDVPVGLGKSVELELTLRLVRGENRVQLAFARASDGNADHRLDDDDPVTLILRPDIEDRNFHETTKASTGPEAQWPWAITPRADRFAFKPASGHTLEMALPGGSFVHEAEWTYSVPHPFEADRGLSGDGDLFSPGYFTVELSGEATAVLSAGMDAHRDTAALPPPVRPTTGEPLPLMDAMKTGMEAFIVKRDDTRTVIAGYPWFLDWGRDTLICLRGIIAAGMHAEARDILVQFARFEDRGTLPNMIRGNDDSNRDTSDAPLWFFTACADIVEAEGSEDFLQTDCHGRTVKEILLSIATNYAEGTPNGICMDVDTGLIFSPSHYTWMDTNHPAGTPREGYPVEIQALWFAALTFLASVDESPRWSDLANQVRGSLQSLYRLPERNDLSDCLLASAGTPAREATRDNTLRSNQLLAVTLGAIDDRQLARDILMATERLLVPGGIRSLADQPVSPPLPIYRDGELLNDPERPFWGHYSGDEDTRRKPAYHNGTAWTWPFPSYCEALVNVYGPSLRETARSLLGSSAILANEGCIGHIPEILDGATPHQQRGCGAQAWGETELYRVLKLLS